MRGSRSLEETVFRRPGWPFLDVALALLQPRYELAERIDRRVQAQEALEHAGEQEDAGADVLLLVELDGDLDALGEAAGGGPAGAADHAAARHRRDAFN